jgi:hypothetical protein
VMHGPVTQGADRAHGGGGGDVGEEQHEVARRILTQARHLRQDAREQEEEGLWCRW